MEGTLLGESRGQASYCKSVIKLTCDLREVPTLACPLFSHLCNEKVKPSPRNKLSSGFLIQLYKTATGYGTKSDPRLHCYH